MALSPWRQNAGSLFRSILPVWLLQYVSTSGSTTCDRSTETFSRGCSVCVWGCAGSGWAGCDGGAEEVSVEGCEAGSAVAAALYDTKRRSPWLLLAAGLCRTNPLESHVADHTPYQRCKGHLFAALAWLIAQKQRRWIRFRPRFAELIIDHL